ncbi:Apoptosis-inducing factor 1, mitochondrial, variant 2 [Dermatophagoides farinae]|uniref:Apoptosis-inducing factor 1, mitochondrial, variant 2 n=1 Tax=Dermatophagoides farinae TaxID=6954 RepID=A0A922L628_DERFA|nr:Apoptosis-inducing factor 1, mitochondrial, variant 2 [Dermatophagoides farinae]
MLFRKSWKFITTNAHRNIIHYNHHHHPRHRQLINAHGRTFSTPSPSPPPPPQQHSNINSSLIFKWIAAGSLVIGVPSYLWLYRSKSNTDAKLTNNTNVSQKQEKDIDKSSIDSSLQLIENLPETVPYLIIGDNMHIARRVLYDGMKAKDLNDVARLFALYPSLTSSSLSAMDVDENSK